MKKRQLIVAVNRSLLVVILITILAMTTMWVLGIRFAHLRSLKLLFAEPVELSAEEEAEVFTWLQENTIHMNTIDARSGYADLQPLHAMIGDARIVALGETSHLNGGFYKVKHRMVEFLVSQMGFTVFTIEAPFGCASTINDYIHGITDVPEDALNALAFTAWRTEEVLDMLIWMREYNSSHDNTLNVYGFDNKPVFGSAKVVYDYLKATSSTTAYDDILLEWITHQFDPTRIDIIERITGDVVNLISYLEGRRPAAGQDQAEWSFAVQNAKVLLQFLEFWGSMGNISKASDMRDQHMGDNVEWIIDYEDGAKTIVWAGNAHITSIPGSGCMGEYLRQRYGDDMIVMALISRKRSSASSNGGSWTAGAGTLEVFLAQAGLDISILDFRSLPKGIVSECFNSSFRSAQGVKTIYPLSYDAVLFVESTFEADRVISQHGGDF